MNYITKSITYSYPEFKKRGLKNKGFTLIELMISVAIVGVLASIAIPLFNEYRMKSFDASAKAHVHNILLTEQAVFSTNGAYIEVPQGIGPGPMGVLPNQNASDGVGYIVHLPNGPTAAFFTAYIGHIKGSKLFAISENIGPLWKAASAGQSPVTMLANEPNAVLTDAWGNR